MMSALKRYLMHHFELVFVLIILLGVTSIVYFIPYKLAFLSFFFIPVLLAAAYLGARQAVLGAVFSFIMVASYAYFFPETFYQSNHDFDLLSRIIVWGSFLILSGAIVGYLNHQLKLKIEEANSMHSALDKKAILLDKTNNELNEFTRNFEDKLAKKTGQLEKSKREIENHKHKVEDALYSTMDPSVVKLIMENKLRTEKRRISILFCDLVNFTLYSETRHAEVIIADLNRYLTSMERILLSYYAHIDKYIGDGIMAEFGAPIDYEHSSLMSVVAAFKMQEKLKQDQFPWKMRIGIATGEPIIGLIGHKRQSYTALGDAVNLASRIETLCSPGEVTIDNETFEEVHHYFETEMILLDANNIPISSLLSKKIDKELARWERDGGSLTQAKKIADLFNQSGEYEKSKNYYKAAMTLDPSDQDAKIKYAELALKSDTIIDVPIKGRKQASHLYKITALKSPLLNNDKIPKALYERYHAVVEALITYPEDIILPVECLDGSIGHSRLVGFLAYAMADTINLSEDEKRNVLEAGYLADIGKSIIPPHILNRKGRLSKQEYHYVYKHPNESIRILQNLEYNKQAVFEIIAAHHENYDGSGYPNNLRAEHIPIGARIVAICEAYSSMTSWRPYREKWQGVAAFSELEKHAKKGKYDCNLMAILKHLLFETLSEDKLNPLRNKIN